MEPEDVKDHIVKELDNCTQTLSLQDYKQTLALLLNEINDRLSAIQYDEGY